MTSNGLNDYDFVIQSVQFLDKTYGISFFITSKDFDLLYNWWEKHIPFSLIQEAISTVVNRWKQKNKPIYSFSNFNHEVRKLFASHMEMQAGMPQTSPSQEPPEEEWQIVARFISQLPAPLVPLKPEFETLRQIMQKKESLPASALSELNQKLLNLFTNDEEINLKTMIFIKNIAPPLRTPEIENRYRINFLRSKYGIPDFE